MKPSSAFSSAAWQELHSLLAEAAPDANASCLHDREGAVAAIEMRPRGRSFEWLLSPAAPMIAKWTVIIFEADWTLHAAVLKMDRQVVEVKEFRLSQTLEVVEFLKTHPFLNSDFIVCEGTKKGTNLAPPPSADFIHEKVSRSSNCELLMSVPPSPTLCSQVCQFCSSDTEVKPPEPKTESGYIVNDQEMCSVKLEVEEDDRAYYDGGEHYDVDADDDDDNDWVDDADDGETLGYEYLPDPGKSVTIFECNVCGKKFSRKGNYTRHMYLHKNQAKDKKSEKVIKGENAVHNVKVENSLGSDDVNESGSNGGEVAAVKTGDSAAKKKRGPYKSRQEPPPGFKRPNINLEEALLAPPAVKVDRKSFKCEACSAIFVSEGRWALHMQKHRGEPGVDVPGRVHQSSWLFGLRQDFVDFDFTVRPVFLFTMQLLPNFHLLSRIRGTKEGSRQNLVSNQNFYATLFIFFSGS